MDWYVISFGKKLADLVKWLKWVELVEMSEVGLKWLNWVELPHSPIQLIS